MTTAWTSLLQEALWENAKQPTTLSFPWNTTNMERLPETELPTVDCPLVYHLFGRLDDPSSLVLSEDDYLNWLVAWVERRRSIPPAVRKALTARSLLFLGYRLDEWDFRAMFQGLKSFSGGELLRRNLHVAVQQSPESQMVSPRQRKST